jgi:hypothetical protein
MRSAFLKALVLLGIILRIAVIGRCTARGQLRRYGFFCLLLSFIMVGSTVYLVRPDIYRPFWDNTRWTEAAVSAAAAIEAFWGVARHFRNIRSFGWILITLIAAISAGAAGLVGILRSSWSDSLGGALLVGQFVNIALFLTAILSVAFFRQFRKTPVRPNAILHLRVLGVLYGIVSAGYFVGRMSSGQWAFLTGFLIISSPLIAYLWWLIGMKPAGEALPFEAPVMSAEEFEAAESVHQQNSRRLTREASEALKRIFR